MIATWMLSALLFTMLAGAAALCAEAALRDAGRQTRWPWLAALGASVTWPVLAPIVRYYLPATGVMRSVAATLPTVQVIPDALPAISWTHRLDIGLLTLWALSSAVVLARLVYTLVMLARIRRASRQALVDGVPVLVSDSIGPAVVGVIRPSVLFPSALLDLDAPLRRLVLRHEQEHCRARDPWIVVGSAFALALVPWNLPLWWIARRVRLALEVDCDARVLATEPDTSRYGKLLMLISQRQRTTILAPMLAASSSHLERRIAAMNPISSRRRRARIIIAVAAMIVAGFAACTSRIADGVSGPKPAVASRSADVKPDQPYFEFQVSKQVQQVAGTGSLRYPDALRSDNVQGDVLVQFVVDEKGEVMPGTFKVLTSSHALFTQAVKDALPTMKFSPAQVQGRNVKQLVQQPFTFSLSSTSSPASGGGNSSVASVRAGNPIRPDAALITGSGAVIQKIAAPRTPPINAAQPYFEFQVERMATQIPGTGHLRYPDELRAANVEGEVLAQFVVGANGQFEPGTFRALKSSHDLFTKAVAAALAEMRFTPAQVGGHSVRQLIQQPFTFSLAKQ